MNRAGGLFLIAVGAASCARAQNPPPACGTASRSALTTDSIRSLVGELLTAPQRKARLAAARALGEAQTLGPRVWTRARLPKDKDPRFALAIALSDPDDSVRIAAACALGRVGDTRALPALDMRAAKSSVPVKAAVEWAAGRIRADAPAPLLLRNATVIDGTGAPSRPRTSVLVEGEVITRVGTAGSFDVPAGARVIDASRRWLVPGLWDMHVHIGKAGREALPVLVGAGITSVRDMGGDLSELLEARRRIMASDIVGPHIVLSGPMLEAPATLDRMSGIQTAEPYRRTRVPVATPADARRVVDSIAALGVDFIKVRETPDLDVYRAIVEAARVNRIPLAGHAPFSMPPLEGAALGLTTLEHASYPYPLDTAPATRRQLLMAFRASGTAIVPTMVAWSSYLMDPDSLALLIADTAGRRDARRPVLSAGLVEEWKHDLASRKRLSDRSVRGWCGFVNRTLEDLAAMHAAGIPILAGTDLATVGLFPGWSLHDELEVLVDGGVLSPADALRSATSLAARHAGQADLAGTIAPGMRADLLLLGADPTKDIGALRGIEAVVLRGSMFDSAALTALRGGVPLRVRSGVDLLPRIEAAGCDVRHW